MPQTPYDQIFVIKLVCNHVISIEKMILTYVKYIFLIKLKQLKNNYFRGKWMRLQES